MEDQRYVESFYVGYPKLKDSLGVRVTACLSMIVLKVMQVQIEKLLTPDCNIGSLGAIFAWNSPWLATASEF